MSITNDNFNARSILGVHRNKVFTQLDQATNRDFNVTFANRSQGNTILLNDDRLNYNPSTGTLSAQNFAGAVSGTTIDVTDDNVTDADFFITFVDAAGASRTMKCDTAGIRYNPTTNMLTLGTLAVSGINITGNITGDGTNDLTAFDNISAVTFTGNGSALTSLTTANLNGLVQNAQLQNDSLTLGTTELVLGTTTNSITGLISLTSTTLNATTGVGIGKSPSYPLDAYIDGANSFQILSQLTNANVNTGSAALSFNVAGNTASGETSISKCAIAFTRNASQGRGDLVFCLNTSASTDPVTLTDEKARLTKAGVLSAVSFSGNGSALTSLTTANLNGLVQNTQLQNDSITIGNTVIALGDTATTLSGLVVVNSQYIVTGPITCTTITTNASEIELLKNTTITGSLTAGNLTIDSGSITDTTGAISFGNENLTTTGDITSNLFSCYSDASNYTTLSNSGSLFRKYQGTLGAGFALSVDSIIPTNYLGELNTTGSISLGSPTHYWGDIHVVNGNFSTNVQSSTMSIGTTAGTYPLTVYTNSGGFIISDEITNASGAAGTAVVHAFNTNPESNVPKCAFGVERVGAHGQSDFYWYSQNSADSTPVSISDDIMRLDQNGKLYSKGGFSVGTETHLFEDYLISDHNGGLATGSGLLLNDGYLEPSFGNSSFATYPQASGYLDLGSSTRRWGTVYTTNGVNTVSDRNSKTQIEYINYNENLCLIGEDILNDICTYKLKEALESKGENKARMHFGVIAQELEETFKSYEIDATKYGVLGIDYNYSKDGQYRDDDKKKYKKEDEDVVEEITYSLRYDELNMMLFNTINSKLKVLEKENTDLKEMLVKMNDRLIKLEE